MITEWLPPIDKTREVVKKSEYRYKLLRVTARDVLCLLNFMSTPIKDLDYLYLRRLQGVPEDAQIVAVGYQGVGFFPPSFVFLVTHPSFPEVLNDYAEPISVELDCVRFRKIGPNDPPDVPVYVADPVKVTKPCL